MKRPILVAILIFISFSCGCSPGEMLSVENPGAKKEQALPEPMKSIDFEALRESVDAVLGKNFQAMDMGGMVTAVYQFDGPIKSAIDVVAPRVKAAGFTEVPGLSTASMGEAEKKVQENMGMKVNTLEQVGYAHPNGDTLTIVRTNVSNALAGQNLEMKLLTLQLMNPKHMAEMGVKLIKPDQINQ